MSEKLKDFFLLESVVGYQQMIGSGEILEKNTSNEETDHKRCLSDFEGPSDQIAIRDLLCRRFETQGPGPRRWDVETGKFGDK